MSRRANPSGRGDSDRSGDDAFAEVLNGFTFGSKRRKRREDQADDRHRSAESAPADRSETDPRQDEVEVASSIRSYTWTGGRTRSNYALEIETLVSTGDAYWQGAAVRLEHQSIAELCRQPRSVAEVAALLSVPIGVARVVLADMAELGLVIVHQTVSESGSAPHMVLMERVLSGLRRL